VDAISGFRECMKVLKHIRILHTVTCIFITFIMIPVVPLNISIILPTK